MALWHEYNPGSASVDLLFRPPAYALRTGTDHYFITPGQAYLHDRFSSHAQTHRYLSLRDPAGVVAIRTPVLRPLGGSSVGNPRKVPPCAFSVFFIAAVPPAGPLSLPPKKAAKETAKGDLFRGGPLWDPSPTTKGAPPPSIPNGGRRTREQGRGLRIATTSDIGHWFRNDTILLFGA